MSRPERWDLERLLAPVIPQLFFEQRYDDGACWHLPGARDKFGSLFTWDDLNHLLRYHKFNRGQLQLIEHNERVPAERVFQKAMAKFATEERRAVDVEALLAHLRE